MTDANNSEEEDSKSLSAITRRGALVSLAGLGVLSASSGTASAADEGTADNHEHLGQNWTGDPGQRGLLLDVGTNTPKAIEGSSDASNAKAFVGFAKATTGFTEGFRGTVNSPKGKGVFGRGTASSGPSIGVEGRTQSPSGIGVVGRAREQSGTSKGVAGFTRSSSGYGLWTPDDAKVKGRLEVGGNLQVSGTKNFVQTVDTTAGPKNVHYNAVESGRARTEHTGTAEMEDGHALVELPEHFDMVTSDEEDLAVQVTPHAEEKVHPQVVETSTRYVSVEDFGDGPDDYSFSFTVKGVRDGFEDEEIVRDA